MPRLKPDCRPSTTASTSVRRSLERPIPVRGSRVQSPWAFTLPAHSRVEKPCCTTPPERISGRLDTSSVTQEAGLRADGGSSTSAWCGPKAMDDSKPSLRVSVHRWPLPYASPEGL